MLQQFYSLIFYTPEYTPKSRTTPVPWRVAGIVLYCTGIALCDAEVITKRTTNLILVFLFHGPAQKFILFLQQCRKNVAGY